MNYRQYNKKGILIKIDNVKIKNDDFYGVCADYNDYLKSKKLKESEQTYEAFNNWLEQYNVNEMY